MIEIETERPSTTALLGEALAKTSRLIGSEIQLARIEVSEKISTAIKAVVALVFAAVFLIVALIFLLQGVVALIVGFGLAASTANFIVGCAIAIVAALAIVLALRSLSPAHLRPERSLRQLHEDAAVMKDELK